MKKPLLIALCVIALVACSKSESETRTEVLRSRLVGEWVSASTEGLSYSFRADGTGGYIYRRWDTEEGAFRYKLAYDPDDLEEYADKIWICTCKTPHASPGLDNAPYPGECTSSALSYAGAWVEVSVRGDIMQLSIDPGMKFNRK